MNNATGVATSVNPTQTSLVATSLSTSQSNKKLITANAGEAFEKYKIKQKERV
jgi:hypothetical protein